MLLPIVSCGSPPDSRQAPEPAFVAGPDTVARPGHYIASFAIPHGNALLDPPAQHFEQERTLSDQLVAVLADQEPGLLEFEWLAASGAVTEDPRLVDFTDWGLSDRQLLGSAGLVRLRFVDDTVARSVLQRWVDDGQVTFFEPDWLNQPLDVRPSEQPDLALLADLYRDSPAAWWLDAIHLPESLELAASLTDPPEPPVVAVLDSGIDYRHQALSGRVWRNPRPGVAGCLNDANGCNTTAKNGFLGDGQAHPYNTTKVGQPCPLVGSGDQRRAQGDCMHGTHVAGIVAGSVAAGVAGVCPMCQLVNIKVVEEIGGRAKVADSSILKALRYVQLLRRQLGVAVRVINSSFGKFQKSKSLTLMMDTMRRDDPGLVIVAAAGNEDSQRPVYPAAESDVIAVTSVGADGGKTFYSNFGVWVDIAAPGGDYSQIGLKGTILSSVPGGDMEYSQGTSMAAPMVSGVAAMLLAYHPEWSGNDVKRRLIASADGAMYHHTGNAAHYVTKIRPENRQVPLLGSGVLDARAALAGESNASVPREAMDRVVDGCASIGSRAHDPSSTAASLVILLALMLPVWRRMIL